eukprot:3490403-Alexandrium_andersonii.AAC.1
MSASLVGSEMCIRDRAIKPSGHEAVKLSSSRAIKQSGLHDKRPSSKCSTCLLYTSDAADDM